MKDKILTALKTKFQNLGFTEKAFGGVADYLSATVTEETQIETAIVFQFQIGTIGSFAFLSLFSFRCIVSIPDWYPTNPSYT